MIGLYVLRRHTEMVSKFEEKNMMTRSNIIQTFLHFLKERELTEISVRDITWELGINRSTFYLHFEDKYDLLTKIEDELIEKLYTQLNALPPVDIKEITFNYSMAMFRFIEIHRTMFQLLLSPNNRPRFRLTLKALFRDNFENIYMKQIIPRPSITIPANYVSAFATSAMLGLIIEWLKDEKAISAEEINENFYKILAFIQEVYQK